MAGAHPTDFDEWAELGATGWAWADVLPYFLKAERSMRGADALHGADGPLQVADQNAPRAISTAFVDAAAGMQIPRARLISMGQSRPARACIRSCNISTDRSGASAVSVCYARKAGATSG